MKLELDRDALRQRGIVEHERLGLVRAETGLGWTEIRTERGELVGHVRTAVGLCWASNLGGANVGVFRTMDEAREALGAPRRKRKTLRSVLKLRQDRHG